MRARNQSGWVEETAARSWKAHWYEYVKDPQTGKERRRHRSRIVGQKAQMRKFEAEAELAKIVSPLNATQTSRRDDRVPLSWFVEHRWQPTVEGGWGATTKKTNHHFVKAILAEFGQKALRELDCVDLQNWLNKLAGDYSRSMVFHCHTYLKAICAEAVDQDFLAKDPARKLKRPKTRKPDETVLEWSQYQAVIDAAVTLRDKLAIKVGHQSWLWHRRAAGRIICIQMAQSRGDARRPPCAAGHRDSLQMQAAPVGENGRQRGLRASGWETRRGA